MKRFLAVLLTLVLLLTSLSVIASAAEEEGIHYDETAKKYYMIKSDGTKATTWYNWKGTESYEDDGEVYEYTFDRWVLGGADGYLVTGWKQVGSVWYYFYPDWPIMCTGTYKIGDEYHLFNNDGAWQVSTKKAGWVSSGKDWYYLNTDEEGYGWFIQGYDKKNPERVVINKTCYAFDENGKLMTGWIEQEYGWSDGASDWYYADKDGALVRGWKQIGGKWYYFTKCYVDYDELTYIYGPWMYYNNVYWIYSSEQDEKGTPYCFTKSGEMLTNAWYHIVWNYEDGDSWDAWCHASASGVVDTGWFKDGGKWYYSGESGIIWMDCPVYDKDNNEYWLGKDGAMLLGWQQVYDTDWSYFKDSGAMVKKDWVQYGGKWYYFDENGLMVHDGTLNINGTDYKFDANGACVL